MKHSHELTLDGNGVPILTEIISSAQCPEQKALVERPPEILSQILSQGSKQV